MNLDAEHAWVTAAPCKVRRCEVCLHHEVRRNRVWCKHWQDWVPEQHVEPGCDQWQSETPF